MQDRQRLFFFIGQTFLFLAVAFLAVYFRTYSLHGGPSLAFRSSESLARDVIDRNVKGQVRETVMKNFPAMTVSEKERLIELQYQRLKSEASSDYEETVLKATSNLETARKNRYRYLLEADPYYFFRLTETLIEKSRISEFRKRGKFLDWFKRAPHGQWTVFLIHPHVGFLWFKALQRFFPQASLMQILGWLSVFLTVLILPLYGALGRILKMSFPAVLVGMATIVLSPIFIQRSALGWYDTDPYNYLFPIGILSFIFKGLKDRKWFWAGGVGASFLTGLYALFWPGWAFVAILVPVCILGSSVIIQWFLKISEPGLIKRAAQCCGFYVVGSFCFLAILITPGGLKDSLVTGWLALHKFALASPDIWPNIFLTVGETGSITLQKLIFLTGNYVTFAFAIAGLLWEGAEVFRRRDAFSALRFFFLVLFAAPLLMISLKTERFSVLFVLPLAIFAGFVVDRFVGWVNIIAQKHFSRIKACLGWGRFFALSFATILFAPLLLLSAHVVALGIKPIMDDVWFEGLTALREQTPQNAIIDSWWPPGYFISAVAKRRVVLDGGSQRYPASYWMAKALIAADEAEAAGILRMLNTSGDDASDLLERWGVKVPDAVDLILKIVRLSRPDALQVLPSFLTLAQKEELLDKTHGHHDLPPSYVLVYNDLVEQNLAMTVFANWDFRKAQALQGQKRKGPRNFSGIFQRDAAQRYIQDILQTSGKWLKYTPIASLARRDGNVLFFTNGLRVDTSTSDAKVFIPAKGIQGAPASLFFFEQGVLVEKKFEKDLLDVSALFFEDRGHLYAVLADADLIRSMLFRLYYLDGRGLSLFKPVLTQGTLRGGTFLRVFELERDKL